MKLFELPRHTTFKVIDNFIHIPPDSLPVSKGDLLTLDHIDGMYGFCYDERAEVCYIAAWTEVQPL